MTGMGNDGADGDGRCCTPGAARTIAEAEETAVVWGMPGELVAAGGADWVLPLPEIAGWLRSWCRDMPLVRKRPSQTPASRGTSGLARARARASSAGRRCAPRPNGPTALALLADALSRESDPRVREAIFTGLARLATAGERRGRGALSPVGRRQLAHRRRRRVARDAAGRAGPICRPARRSTMPMSAC